MRGDSIELYSRDYSFGSKTMLIFKNKWSQFLLLAIYFDSRERESFPLRKQGHHCIYIKCQALWNCSLFDFNFIPSQRCTHKITSLFHVSKWDERMRFNSNLENEWPALYNINILKTLSFSLWPITSCWFLAYYKPFYFNPEKGHKYVK